MYQILVFAFSRRFHIETSLISDLIGMGGQDYVFTNPFEDREFEEGDFAGYHFVIIKVKMEDPITNDSEKADFFRDLEDAMGEKQTRTTFAGRMVQMARTSAYAMRYNEANVGWPALWTEDKDMGDGLGGHSSGYYRVEPSDYALVAMGYAYSDAKGGFSLFELFSDEGLSPDSSYKVEPLLDDDAVADLAHNLRLSFSSTGLTVDRKIATYDRASNTYVVTNG